MGQQEHLLPTVALPWRAIDDSAANDNASLITDQARTIIEAIAMFKHSGVEQLAVVNIVFYFDCKVQENEEQEGVEQSIRYYGTYLSDHVQPSGYILLYQQEAAQKAPSFHALQVYRLYFLLGGISNKGAAIIKDQLWEMLLRRLRDENMDEQIHRPAAVAAGYSAYPYPCATMQQSVEEALAEQVKVELADEGQGNMDGNVYQSQIALVQMARNRGIPYVASLPQHISSRLKHLITPTLAQELQCYPIGRERNTLTVAMVNPCDQQALIRLQRTTGLQIFPVLADPYEMQVALERII